MNSERRHELQKNELADALGGYWKKVEPYAPAILTGVIAVVVAALTIGYLQSRSANQRSDATLTYLIHSGQANTESLANVALNYPGTQAASLALLAKADIELAEGSEGMFTVRKQSVAQLEQAVEDYRQVLGQVEDTLLRSRASLGLARSLEALGDVEGALAAYEQVVAADESAAMVKAAEQRIASLNRPETVEFLTWFGEQDPETTAPAETPGMPDSATLPDAPDMEIPENFAVEPPANEKPAVEEMNKEEAAAAEKAAQEKEAADMKAAEEKAAAEKAAEEKKAAEMKAAEEKKAAEMKAVEEKAAADKAAEEKKAAEMKAAEEKAAAEKAAEEKKAAEMKAAEEKAAAEKAAEEKKAAEMKAAEEKAAAEKAAEEKKAAEMKAAEEKAAAEKAAEEKKAAEMKAAEEKAAADKAAAEKKAAEEKAAAEKAAAEKKAADAKPAEDAPEGTGETELAPATGE
ncbi:hypothetical protein FF011L_44230 [Roseimaritima multifibrata]|uniref:Uncharacterized protein n=1 Tax=Roseimaritima multifibrata TaxID=1930274 RepID=A0A517ML53_9BACT|nr:tetratricopeptide repeat protein [Roseimaritima multifibrata]QDS95625.1 hypothetical protein FF011L_44230 [Roseimaritima multifibrata]